MRYVSSSSRLCDDVSTCCMSEMERFLSAAIASAVGRVGSDVGEIYRLNDEVHFGTSGITLGG